MRVELSQAYDVLHSIVLSALLLAVTLCSTPAAASPPTDPLVMAIVSNDPGAH